MLILVNALILGVFIMSWDSHWFSRSQKFLQTVKNFNPNLNLKRCSFQEQNILKFQEMGLGLIIEIKVSLKGIKIP